MNKSILVLTALAGIFGFGHAGSAHQKVTKRNYHTKISQSVHSKLHSGFHQTGIASWYGSYWQNKKTASGAKFNQWALTCAHRSLPLGSKVLVTNIENHKSIIVKVNDRGPYVGNRIIDLSKGAAVKIGFAKNGLSKVRIQAISFPPEVAMAR